MTIAFILSITALITVFDTINARISSVSKKRKALAVLFSIGFGLLTLFMATMHIVQMACDEEGVATCLLPNIYDVGLKFSQSWASQTRVED